MANNRMAFVCSQCNERFPILKYYPSTGWYINREQPRLASFGQDLNDWLDRHVHRSMFGNEIVVVKETE